MNEYVVLLKRELLSLTREKTIILAIMVQLLIASLASVILQGIMAFYDPASIGWGTGVSLRAGFIGEADSPLPAYLRSKGIIVKPFSELTSAEAAFRDHQIDTILFVPEGQSNVANMKLILPGTEARKMVILVMLDEPLKEYEDYLRQANGIEVNYKDFGGQAYSGYEFLYSVLIPILMLFPALVAGSIVIDDISEEFENKTLDTLISAPVSGGQVLVSKMSAAIIAAVIQLFMSTGLLIWNGIVVERLILVLLLAVSFAVAISLGAAIIALWFKDRQRAQFVYSMTLITAGAAGYFLNPSPFELLAKLSSGALDFSALAVGLYTTLPIAIGLAIFYRSKRLVLAGK